jgi:hypothetical protein
MATHIEAGDVDDAVAVGDLHDGGKAVGDVAGPHGRGFVQGAGNIYYLLVHGASISERDEG